MNIASSDLKKNNRQEELGSNSLILIIPLIILIAGSLIHYYRGSYAISETGIQSWGLDDSFITYRYSWNLAHHNILSWNESGYRVTEGFTNPLWVLLNVPWALFGVKDWVYPLSLLTSMVLSLGLFAILINAVYQRFDRTFASILGMVAVALIPAIWLHVTSGLESGVFGIGLATLGYLAIFPPKKSVSPYLLSILTVFLGLLRSDGFIYLGILVIGVFIAGSRSWKPILVGLGISVIILFTWRFLTYGTLLPNTAVAKVNFSLLERLPVALIFLRASVFNSGLIVFLLFGLAGLWLETRRIFYAGLFIFLAWIAYYIYIGGDAYFERHLVGLYFLMAAFSAKLWVSAKRRTRVLLMAVILLTLVASIRTYEGRFDYFSPKIRDTWVMLGKAVETDRERYGTLITFAAGKISYFAGGDNVDLIGLNDPHLATFRLESFVPGHSSGNLEEAIKLASSNGSGIYSTFSFLDPDYVEKPEDVALWVNNYSPQETVQQGVSDADWNNAKSEENIYIWSIISEPNKQSE